MLSEPLPRCSQEAPDSPPRAIQEAQRAPQEAPRGPQDANKRPQDPKRTPRSPFVDHPGPPFLKPSWDQKSQKSSKNALWKHKKKTSTSTSIFDRFSSILEPCWLPKSTKNRSNIDKQIDQQIDWFFDRFLIDFSAFCHRFSLQDGSSKVPKV